MRFFKTLATVFKNGGQTLPEHSKVAPEAAPESNLNRILKKTPYLHGRGRPKGAGGSPKISQGAPQNTKKHAKGLPEPLLKDTWGKDIEKRGLWDTSKP